MAVTVTIPAPNSGSARTSRIGYESRTTPACYRTYGAYTVSREIRREAGNELVVHSPAVLPLGSCYLCGGQTLHRKLFKWPSPCTLTPPWKVTSGLWMQHCHCQPFSRCITRSARRSAHPSTGSVLRIRSFQCLGPCHKYTAENQLLSWPRHSRALAAIQ